MFVHLKKSTSLLLILPTINQMSCIFFLIVGCGTEGFCKFSMCPFSNMFFYAGSTISQTKCFSSRRLQLLSLSLVDLSKPHEASLSCVYPVSMLFNVTDMLYTFIKISPFIHCRCRRPIQTRSVSEIIVVPYIHEY